MTVICNRYKIIYLKKLILINTDIYIFIYVKNVNQVFF